MTGDYTHCPKCGGGLQVRHVEDRDRLVCAECEFVFYRNPVPAAGVILIEDGRLLWVKRRFAPREGMWTLPAGFVEYGEHPEACATREAREETGLDLALTGLFNAYMAEDDPRVQVVLLLYTARRLGGTLAAGDDAAEVRFFPVDEAPAEIAFRAHRMALADIRDRLAAP